MADSNAALYTLNVLARRPELAIYVNEEIDRLPAVVKEQLRRRLVQLPDLSPEEIAFGKRDKPFLSSDMLLTRDWPEPIWVIPGVIPAGLTVLGGAPKLGKSWMALQFSLAVAAGGYTFGKQVSKGPVLYLALEDPPRRLKERMVRQGWAPGLPADFLTVGRYQEIIGDVRNGGGDRLARYIEGGGYRLIVIDTLSRAIQGDQNDAVEMTQWLTPLQEITGELNCCILLLDHHNKIGSADAVRDLLGSTAKGAMADTIIGLYRERGKPDARLTVTGREVPEQTLNIRYDHQTGAWQMDTNPTAGLTADQADLILALEDIQPATTRQIVEALGKRWPEDKGRIWNRLVSLEEKQRVWKFDDKWRLQGNTEEDPHTR